MRPDNRHVELRPGAVRMVDGPPVPLAPGEARIRVEACGMCGTDLHLLHGMALPPGASYPVRPGHEVAGRIVEVAGDEVAGDEVPPDTDRGAGAGADLEPGLGLGLGLGLDLGATVVLHPLDPCGRCRACTSGQEQHCARARVLGITAAGGMADEVVWPLRRLVPVAGLDCEQAALLPDAVATAYRALRLAEVPVGGTLVVLGAGGVGTHLLQLARAADPSVRLVAVARSQGTVDRLRSLDLDLVHRGLDGLRDAVTGAVGPADAVVDFSGSGLGPRQGIRLLRHGGRLVLGSVVDEPIELGSITTLVTRGIQVIGSYSSSIDDLRAVARLAEDGSIDLSGSVSMTLPLADAEAAFGVLEQRPPGLVRIVLRP